MSVASFVSETDIQKKRNNNWTVLLNFGVGSRLLTEGSCVCGLGEIDPLALSCRYQICEDKRRKGEKNSAKEMTGWEKRNQNVSGMC